MEEKGMARGREKGEGRGEERRGGEGWGDPATFLNQALLPTNPLAPTVVIWAQL